LISHDPFSELVAESITSVLARNGRFSERSEGNEQRLCAVVEFPNYNTAVLFIYRIEPVIK